MSQKKRPSLADVANIASEAVSRGRREFPPDEEPAPAPEAPKQMLDEKSESPIFKKFTAPFRGDQLDELSILLARWTASKHVKFSAAEVLRLGLDRMLRLMEDDPDQAILELYRQEQRETEASETRKFGRSKGAKEYLKKAGKL